MTNFSIYGTLLTREEAKKIRGGSTSMYCMTDYDCPSGSMCYGGICTAGGANPCPTDPADCHGQACTVDNPNGGELNGTCKIDAWMPYFCACVVTKI